MRLLPRLRSPAAPPRDRVEPRVIVPKRDPMKVSHHAVAQFLARDEAPKQNPWKLPTYVKGVLPGGRTELAQDEAIQIVANAWDFQTSIHGMFAEGIGFMGYPYLAELSQRAEYRRASEVVAEEMTRKWIELKATGEEDKTDKIKVLADRMADLKVRDVFRTALENDGFFGIGLIMIDLGDGEDREELASRLPIRPEKIGKGRLKGFRVIDPTWVAPNRYNARDPANPAFYVPQSWFVMGTEIHATRILTLISRPMPDLLKPAYNFGGLSLSQMIKPYVDNWLRTRQSVSDLLNAFTVFNLATNMAGLMAGAGGNEEAARLELFTNMRNNRGLLVTDKETEQLTNVSAPLGTLDHLQAQSQEQICSVAAIPLVKYLGVTPSGLNACLTADTLIETDHGQVPIRDVHTGHRVMTREGWAPLAWSGQTDYATELVEIRTADSTIRCTDNHPIWLPEIGAFVAAGNVRAGDLLLYRGATERSQGMARQSHGAGGSGGIEAMAIMPPAPLTIDSFCCTEKSGASTTGLSREAATSTISTAIAGTISSIISRCSKHLSTRRFMAWLMGSSSTSTSLTNISAAIAARPLFRPSPPEPCYAAIGAGSQIGGPTGPLPQSLDRSSFARHAASLLRPDIRPPNTARGDAATDLGSRSRARKPEQLIIAHTTVIESVERVKCKKQPVYDLTVADGYLPEFFANGILTHNSADGEIRVFYDGISAKQEKVCSDAVRTVLEVLQLDEFGEIDPEIVFEWVPLWELDEAAAATVRKTEADTDAVLVELGAIDPDEVRQRIAAEPESPYAGLDLSKPAPGPQPGPEDPGGQGGGELPPGQEGGDQGGFSEALLAALREAGVSDPLGLATIEGLRAKYAKRTDPVGKAVIAAFALDAFNPNQKRGQPGNAGQFGPGGGGGGGAKEPPAKKKEEAGGGSASKPGPASSLMPEPKKYSAAEARQVGDRIAAAVGATKEIAGARRQVDALNGAQSIDPVEKDGHTEASGNFTPERVALHDDILSRLFTPEVINRATPEAGQKPVMVVLGGRGGSGKSWLTDPAKGGPVDKSKFVVVDADHFKGELPEYQGWNAAQLHEESDVLVRRAEDIARALGLNIVHDATMKSAKGINDRVDRYAQDGYEIHGHYMHLPPEEATKRATERFSRGLQKTGQGRFVPPEVILGNTENEKNFDALIHRFKDWSVFDNSGDAPKFVAGSRDHGRAKGQGNE